MSHRLNCDCSNTAKMPRQTTRRAWLVHLFTISILLGVVKGNHLLTIAVAAPGDTNSTVISDTSEFILSNGTTPDVTVLWTTFSYNPFQIAQHLAVLAGRQVDLLILPDDLDDAVEELSGIDGAAPVVVSYAQGESEGADNKQLCNPDLDFPLTSSSEPDENECNGTEARVSKAEALVAVIQELEWESLIVVFEENQEMVATELSDRLGKVAADTLLLYYSVTDEDSPDDANSSSGPGLTAQQLIQTLYDKRDGDLRVVLLCSVQCISQVLTTASQFDQLNDKKTAMALISRWLLALPPNDQQSLESCNLELDNVAVVAYPPKTVRPAVTDISKDLEDILQNAYDKVLDNNITMSPESLSEAIKQSLEIPQNCYRSYVKTLLWKPDGRRLSDVGYVGQDMKIHMGEGQEVFPNIKFGLNNRKFIVATLPWPSFVDRTPDGGYKGLCVDLMHQLQVMLNFSYEWTEPEDQEWGLLTENGTWTGLVGLLAEEKVDMVMAPISVQANREQVMDFTHPFYFDYTTVLLKLPDPAESKWKTLIQPFQAQVHMCIWISLLCVTIITFTLEFLNPFYITNTQTMLNPGDMFWYMFGALLTQGGARLPDSQTGRTMVSAFWLFSIVMAAIYSGNLIAFLTVSKDKAPFDTLRGMVEQDRYKWGALGGTFYEKLFQNSPLWVFRKVWEGLEREQHSDPDVLSGDPAVQLAKVKAGYYAYIGDKSAISTWLKSECDLITIKEDFLPLQYAVGLINNSAYTSMFSDAMLEINEIGLTETWVRKWWSKTSFCTGTLTASATPIELIDVQSAFYLVFIGITASLLVLLMEKTSHRFHIGTRIKQFCSRKKERSAKPSTCNSSWAYSTGVTMRQIIENDVNGRPLGSEFQHTRLFQRDALHSNNPHSNGRATVIERSGQETRSNGDSKVYFTYGPKMVRSDAQLRGETEPIRDESDPNSVVLDTDKGSYGHCNGMATSSGKLANGTVRTN